MDAPQWNGDPPDDDPEGEYHEEHDICPKCGADDGDPCEYGCDCDACQSAGEREWIRRHQFT